VSGPEGERRAKLRFRRATPATSPLPSTLHLRFRSQAGVGEALLSTDEKLSFGQLAALPKLAAHPWLAPAQARLGEGAALGLFADARVLAPGLGGEAPILLSFGKKGPQVSLGLAVSPGALPALARLFAVEKSP